MEYCNYLLIFEGILFRRKLKLLIIYAALLGLRMNVPWQFNGHSLFPFGLGGRAMSPRPLLFIPHLPLGVDGSNFLADFSAISACSTNSFQYGLWQPPCEPLLGLRSCAYMSVRAWVMASLQGTSKTDFWTAQCSHGQIRPSSAR